MQNLRFLKSSNSWFYGSWDTFFNSHQFNFYSFQPDNWSSKVLCSVQSGGGGGGLLSQPFFPNSFWTFIKPKVGFHSDFGSLGLGLKYKQMIKAELSELRPVPVSDLISWKTTSHESIKFIHTKPFWDLENNTNLSNIYTFSFKYHKIADVIENFIFNK